MGKFGQAMFSNDLARALHRGSAGHSGVPSSRSHPLIEAANRLGVANVPHKMVLAVDPNFVARSKRHRVGTGVCEWTDL